MDSVSNISFMLQNTLIGYYKTGHIIVDMIIALLVVAFCQKIMSSGINIDSFITFLKRKKRIKSEYVIEGRVKNGSEAFAAINSVTIPIEFKALMYKMHIMKAKIKSAKQYDRVTDVSSGKHYSYVINDIDDVQVTDDVWVKQMNRIERSNDNKIETESFSLHVFSYTLTFNELQNLIIEWVKEYDSYLRALNDNKKIYYYSYFGCDVTPKKNLIFDRSVFESNKTFDNVFFDQKEELIERLKFFTNGEREYKRLGTPYTLGFLFYGEPGCGKTSTIKAIANYTGRHVISIPLSRVETCREFSKIFMDEFLMDRYVPIKSRIYVFEDIDCMSNIVADRDQISTKIDERDSNKVVVCLKDGGKEGDNSNLNKKDLLTLSYVLNMIDGILEQPGRIIIMTTNKPDKMDKALLRPGRIDMKIHFSKCSSKTTRQIFEFFFRGCVEKIKSDSYNFSENKFSPAEIFEICYNGKNINDSYAQITNQ